MNLESYEIKRKRNKVYISNKYKQLLPILNSLKNHNINWREALSCEKCGKMLDSCIILSCGHSACKLCVDVLVLLICSIVITEKSCAQ